MRVVNISLVTMAIALSTTIAPAVGFEINPIKPAVFTKKHNDPYLKVSSDPKIRKALDVMKGTAGDYSRNAILGKNLTNKPIKVSFRNLGAINPKYGSYDALGWKIGKQLYIYINPKHRTAPPEALASLLSHEAMHQDGKNSILEETYAWTLEAAVWTELTEKNPSLMKNFHPLVYRENTLSKLYKKANYSSKYIRKTVQSNPGYKGLPLRSPGFERTKI